MGKYLDIIRRAESERVGCDKSVLSDRSTPLRSLTSLMSHVAAPPPSSVDTAPTAVCAVCSAGGELWTLDTPTRAVAVHEECARFVPKPEPAEPSAAYQATSAEPDGTACRVTIIEIPAKGLRFRRTFAHLQLKPPALIDVTRWRQCVEDGKRFLAKWGEQAQALNWTSADLFGLHTPPEQPHPSYRRLSRYDQTGLIWLLEGRPVVALTAHAAAVENPTGKITTYRRFNKPSYRPGRQPSRLLKI
jgi:hypothetical protein